MINEKAVSKALLDQLKTVVGLPAIVTDNGSNYTPNPDQPYVREFDLSGDTFAPPVNSNGYQRKDGVYQVDICVPKNKGKWSALDYCALIQVAFVRGLRLDGDRLIIKETSRSAPRTDSSHYIITLSIGYTALS
jgi:hypothetical protein